MYGTRFAFMAGAIAVSVALAIGIPVGLLIGYRRGWVDRVVMRFVETVVAIPAVVLAIAIIAVVGPGLVTAMFAIGIVYSMIITRLTRAEAFAAREELYVDGARAAGATGWRIMFRHMLPNIAPVLIVQTTLLFAQAVLAEAALSFLGLGANNNQASWGLAQAWGQRRLAKLLASGTDPLGPVIGNARFVPSGEINSVLRQREQPQLFPSRAKLLERAQANCSSLLSQILYYEQSSYLPPILVRLDKSSMASALECRVPFLDPSMVQFSFRIADRLKLQTGRECKVLVKKAALQWLPHDLIYRRKVGLALQLPSGFVILRDWANISTCCTTKHFGSGAFSTTMRSVRL